MRAVIAEIRELIEAEGFTTYFVNVPAKPEFPYVLLWSSAGRQATQALSGDDDHISDTLGVTYVATLAESVLDMAPLIRPVLDRAVFMTDEHAVWLRLHDSQTVRVDYDVSIPGQGNPVYAVDLFRVVAEPLRSGSSA